MRRIRGEVKKLRDDPRLGGNGGQNTEYDLRLHRERCMLLRDGDGDGAQVPCGYPLDSSFRIHWIVETIRPRWEWTSVTAGKLSWERGGDNGGG